MDVVAKDFFISYTAADKAWASWIAYILEADGFAVTIQEWDFRPGSNFAVEMDKALKQCPRMIAVLSPAYLKAPFPASEWAAVFASDPEGAKNALVPIMVQECQPEGLLSQVVQIRIHGLDEAAARKQILEGVRRERNKPATPPPFPGTSVVVPAEVPAQAVPYPTASAATPASPSRLRWQSPAPPVSVSWRSDLDQRAQDRRLGAAAVEVHLAFAADDARLQVRELGALADLLPDHGRQHGVFTRLEALHAHADSAVARATSSGRDNEKGLVVTRSGQRSAWAPLPRGQMGAVLDRDDLIKQLTGMLNTLTALDLPHGDLVVPAIGLDPATMISYGRVNVPSNTATYGFGQADHIHVSPDEAIDYGSVVARPADVAAELVARLIADHRAATGLR
ncbi:toll/interleukin-1 receptor domain-containing protein [Micromonospora sp. SL1-18]|uniref:toll/interleukin-1 receptor domain-containing protein n=1 Tax=Micromonospora sp. SL1-18 TaxID=3399128 RepID=UPI003A4D3832